MKKTSILKSRLTVRLTAVVVAMVFVFSMMPISHEKEESTKTTTITTAVDEYQVKPFVQFYNERRASSSATLEKSKCTKTTRLSMEVSGTSAGAKVISDRAKDEVSKENIFCFHMPKCRGIRVKYSIGM